MYERDFKSSLPPTRQHFSEHTDVEVDSSWHHEGDPTDPQASQRAPRIVAGSFFRKILTISFIFFFISAGLLLYMFFGGWNIISASNVEVTFLGPYSISAGSELAFDVVVDNQNRSAIEKAVLYIDYPDGTKQVADITADLTHDKIDIGEVLSKATARRTARSIIFGELNTKRSINVTLEYGLKNSNATYRKEKVYDVTISSTPLTVEISKPQQLVSGESVNIIATVTSNSSEPLTNVLLRVDYPFGFAFTNASPVPNFENNTWLIPTLGPGEKLEYSIQGTLQGEQGDERVFKVSIGTQDKNNEKIIGVRYLAQTESIFIQKMPLAISVALNSSSTPIYTTQQGDSIFGTINITNNLPVQINDAKIEVLFSGQLFNPSSVQASPGYYQSLSNSILWDKSMVNSLASLDPGETVLVTFSFATLPPSVLAVRNGKMSFKATVSGSQSTDSATSIISYSQAKTIQTQTSIGVVPQITYSTGPFRNRGPMPPKVDTPTTYTVTLSATNSSNDIRAGEIRAQLP
ncbi:MAG: protein of unknown function with transrane region, partial [Candidatus Paceibacter sp.]|nr:protein of unknown function with transrane region [Candidatus Paceibacter sp.]